MGLLYLLLVFLEISNGYAKAKMNSSDKNIYLFQTILNRKYIRQKFVYPDFIVGFV